MSVNAARAECRFRRKATAERRHAVGWGVFRFPANLSHGVMLEIISTLHNARPRVRIQLDFTKLRH
jgi:hypothetical protein